ncbi:pyridoxamine 5'-phosphate oxidase family protein [Kitasatospora sp. NPDC050543]|uniref:pyridoxamine 5'-phosphate oxidase family protein n=1 Tax=Kitasatospora sp. NPDC050543 TaxID=3364054 RepID=UPI0037BC64E1
MTSRFAQLAFTESVRSRQEQHHSRDAYARLEQGPPVPDRLSEAEADFIATRDSFYLASVGEDGWPYVQHRGGPEGFLRVLDPGTIAFADFRGNRQYITTGNLLGNDRVALLLMDYPRQARLKILGRARVVEPPSPELLEALTPGDYRARIERAVVITVEAYDWNCRQHIRPRFTIEEVESAVAPLRERLAELDQENAQLRAAGASDGRAGRGRQ